MGYLYETHMHTSQGSACAHVPGAEMARLYKEAGYTGIVITDHFWGGNTAIDRSLEWADWVNGFCDGYEDAKRLLKEAGFTEHYVLKEEGFVAIPLEDE